MTSQSEQPQQAVRFSSVNEEIDPVASLQHVSTLTSSNDATKEELCPEAEEEIKNLSMTLQKSRCQARRMENFSFEPVSLPPSRASQLCSVTTQSANQLAGALSSFGLPHPFFWLSFWEYSTTISPYFCYAFPAIDSCWYVVKRWKNHSWCRSKERPSGPGHDDSPSLSTA